MTSPDSAELTLPLGGTGPDPDLEALPEPRRPGRRLTLAVMTATLVAALGMCWILRGTAAYAWQKSGPVQLGNLTSVQMSELTENSFVEGEALLGSGGAIRFGRPLDGQSYRLAPVAGNNALWVEIRVPEGLEGPRFVPPSTFQGRLVRFGESGLQHRGLPAAIEQAGGEVPGGAWLLVDGTSPTGSRWAIGLIALFLGFALFNGWGLYRLLRPSPE